MYTILLSGGSGKRLWPLSSAKRSKQYIRLLSDGMTGKPCSMIQRVWGQLQNSGLDRDCIICAGLEQTELIRSQLGGVKIAVEPEARDTFPAVALSCAYLKSRLQAADDEIVCILPADPYTEQSFFETLKLLPQALLRSGAEIVLMGVKPVSTSGKYGYILPAGVESGYIRIDSFREKPDESEAKRLVDKGALWNCGVFCLKIGTVMEKLRSLGFPSDYDTLYKEYPKLPAISFDYEILEKSKNLAAVPFRGMWKDLGTWGSISEILGLNSHGDCIVDPSCKDVQVINETQIPVVALGAQELMIVASYDGILITDKGSSPRLKQVVNTLNPRPGCEERSWGTVTVLDYSRSSESGYLVRKVRVFAKKGFGPQSREHLDQIWTVLGGRGKLTMNGNEKRIGPGDTAIIPSGAPHSLFAEEDLLMLQVQSGRKKHRADQK